MRKTFDWSPHLQTNETILWQESYSERAVARISLVATIGCAALSYFILHSVLLPASLETGVESFRPAGYAKAMLAFSAGLILTVFLGFGSFLLCFVENHLVITNQRIIDFHMAAWRKAPRVKSLSLEQVSVDSYGKGSSRVRIRDTSLSMPALPWLQWGILKSHRSNRAFAATIEAAKTAHANSLPPSSQQTAR